MAQNPAGVWKFNEGSGDLAFDSSGAGDTAYLSSGVKWVQTGNTWTLSSDRGRRGYVTIPLANLAQTKAVTVTLWVKRLYTTNSGGVLFEAGKDYQHSDSGFALLPDDETCHGMQAVLRGNEGTTANCYAQPTSGVWHQIAAVYDKSQTGGNAISLYIDGVVQIPTWNLSSATNTNNFGNNPVYLLSRGGNSQFTSGTISDFRIYDGALSEEEIQQSYNETMLASPASISYVQGNYADPQTSQASVAVRFNSAQAAGNFNVVVIGWKDSHATISQVSDSKGNAYTRAVGPTILSGVASQAIYYAKNIAAAGAGTNTVTVAFSTAASKPDIRIAEYGGVDTTNPVDVTAAASGSGRTASSGNATTTNADDLILGANTVLSITSGPGSGYTKRLLSSPQGNILEDQSVSTTGSYSATAPLALSGKWIMQMIALRGHGPQLQSITVTPTNPSIAVGGHQQFTATGNYSDGSHQNLTNSATWSSSSQAVATINSSGYATGVAAGTTTIKAQSGSIYGTTTLTVTGSSGSFTISASPSSMTVPQGNQGTSRITTTVSNGFNSSISLSASGVPTGTSVSFNPQTISAPGSGNSTMTVSVGSSTPAGNYTITVTGNGGGVQQSTPVTLAVTTSGASTVSYVQGNYAAPQSSKTSVSVLYNNAQIAGDLNVVVVGWNDSTATVSSVQDSKGNVYTRAVGPTIVSGAISQSIYYAKNIVSAAAGSNTVTVTFSTAAQYADIRIHEYSGADRSNPVDVTAAASGNSSSSSSGSATTTNPNDLLFGANIVLTLTSGAGSGFTSRVITSPDGDISEDRAVNTNGSYSATAPLSSSGTWIMQMVAFRAAGGSPVLTSIALSPTNPSIAVGGHQQFTATGTYSDGSHQDLTSTAAWSSSNQSVATITTAGLATGVAAGTTTIKATSGSISGSTSLTVTGSGTFSISSNPSSQSVAQGDQGSSTITTTVSGGFNSSISLSASGVPSGTTVAFNPGTIAAPGSGSSAMTITVGAGTAVGTYPITVTGNGGGIQQSTTFTLTVTGAPTFSITASPSTLTIMEGTQRSSTITTTISGGFNSSIALSASGVPFGTSVTFNPTTIPAPGSGTATMMVNVGTSTRMGTYTITVTGNGGGVQRTTTVTITVTGQVLLSWTASQSPGIAGYNVYRSMASTGPFSKINSGLVSTTNYNDGNVQDGTTYYYVTTAVDNQGNESSYSNQASATLP